MNTDIKEDEFEYNDGLGDLLRQKEHLQFSWAKTITLVASIVFIIGIGLWYISRTDSIDDDYVIEESIEIPLTEDLISDDFAQPQEKTIPEIKPEIKSDIVAVKPVKKETKDIKETKEKAVSATKKQTVSVTKQATPTHYPFKVYAGAFSSKENAQNQVNFLKQKGIESYYWTKEQSNKTVYIVQAGAFESRENAQVMVDKLGKMRVDSYIVKKD